MNNAENTSPERLRLDRRTVLLALAAAVAPGVALAAIDRSWVVGTQILAGTGPRNRDFLAAAVHALQVEFGTDTAVGLLDAVLERDAARISDPFDDSGLEAAARRMVEFLYTGDLPSGSGADIPVGFQEALAWQVLGFTKAPSVCGPGFGWWNAAPASVS